MAAAVVLHSSRIRPALPRWPRVVCASAARLPGYALLRPQLLPDGGLLPADEAWQRELKVELQAEAAQGTVTQTGSIHCLLSWDPQPLAPPVRSHTKS